MTYVIMSAYHYIVYMTIYVLYRVFVTSWDLSSNKSIWIQFYNSNSLYWDNKINLCLFWIQKYSLQICDTEDNGSWQFYILTTIDFQRSKIFADNNNCS